MSAEDLAGEGCGATLVQARDAAGVSQRDVADALHLPVHVIDAIERGDKSRLPAYVFTRGYVRAYAKLLDLEPDPLVVALSFEYGNPMDEPGSQAVPSSVPATGLKAKLLAAKDANKYLRGVPTPGLAAGVAAVLVIVVLMLWVMSADDPQAPDSKANPQMADNLQTRLDDVAGDSSATVDGVAVQAPVTGQGPVNGEVALAAGEEQPREDSPVSAAGGDEFSGNAPEGDEPAALVVPQAVVAEAEPAEPSVRRLTASGEDSLTLQFTDECWVEISSSSGEVLFGDLGKPGEVMEFVGAGPFRVLLGYASGVIMLYNAEPIALAPHTRNNVAKLVIGQ